MSNKGVFVQIIDFLLGHVDGNPKDSAPTTPISQTLEPNQWFHYNDSDTAFVFVHGLLSSPTTCWTNTNGRNWPNIVHLDPSLSEPAIFVASYHTSVSSDRYDIGQCVSEVIQALKLRKNGVDRSVIGFPNILFICHSLGGVVCRRMLEEHQHEFRDKNIGIVLMASPSMGSTYAKKLQKIGNRYGHQILHQLLPNSDALQDIDNRFRALLERNEFSAITGAEAVEHHGPLRSKFLPQLLPPVVDEHSASRYFGRSRIIATTDHFSIVKPSSDDDAAHLFLREYFIEKFSKHRLEVPKEASQGTSQSMIASPVFEVFKGVHCEYYLRRTADDDLNRHLNASSVWVWGESGVGKTSTVKHWLWEKGQSPIEISLANLGEDNIPLQLAAEFRESLESKGYRSHGTGMANLVGALCSYANSSSVPIFVDEIPLRSSALLEEVPRFLGNILDAVKRAHESAVHFVFCSVQMPKADWMPEKMREQVHILELRPWSDQELYSLIALVSEGAGIRSLSDQSISLVLQEAQGSPRFVKTWLRNLIGITEPSIPDQDAALQRTKSALRGMN